MNDMQLPPRQLDGAEVLLWAMSERESYHTIPHGANPLEEEVVSVKAMAICRYTNGDCYYLFKCDQDWDVVFDWDAASVDEAQAIAQAHAIDETIVWRNIDA